MAKGKVLIVEDTKVQAEAVKTFLEKSGYETIWAKDGTSALKLAGTQKVDVILLDLILPDINGNEVCRWLKLKDDTRGIPIIMLTVKDTLTDKVAGLEGGADDYLPKPFSEVELNARIYACLRTKSLQDELRQRNQQLEGLLAKVEIMACTDHLTGVYNRRRFEAVFDKEFKMSIRYNTPLSCIITDIDYFKRINDFYGHHTGDVVLKEVAKLITQSIREVDTVARWGGEEFIILLPRTSIEGAQPIALRILATISEHKMPSIPQERITVSIGIGGIPNESIDSMDKLIQVADTALSEAKRNGRNRIEPPYI